MYELGVINTYTVSRLRDVPPADAEWIQTMLVVEHKNNLFPYTVRWISQVGVGSITVFENLSLLWVIVCLEWEAFIKATVGRIEKRVDLKI